MSENTTNKKIFFFSIFLIPSLLCLGFYYFAIRKPLTQGRTNIFVKLPHYGPAQFDPGKDSIFYTLPDFSFYNQKHESVNQTKLLNKIYIISISNFNSEASNQLAAQLYRVQDKLSYLKKDFQIITVLNTTETDTLHNLQSFAETVHADRRIWNIVAGPQQEISNVFKNNNLLLHPNRADNETLLLLIDRKNQVRGCYEGNNLKDVNRLIDEVVVLAAEYGKIKNM